MAPSEPPIDVVQLTSPNSEPGADDENLDTSPTLPVLDLSDDFDSTFPDDGESPVISSPAITPPEEPKNAEPDFDTYQDLLTQGSHQFDWNPDLFIPSEQNLLALPNMHTQQAPLYYDPSFFPSSSQIQPAFSHIHSPYDQAQPIAAFDTSSTAQPPLAGARVVHGQINNVPTSATERGESDERHILTHVEVSHPRPLFFASADMPPPPPPPTSSPLSTIVTSSSHVESNFPSDSENHEAAVQRGLPISSAVVVTSAHSSNKENVSPNVNARKATTVNSSEPPKKVVPRPKARPAAAVTKKAGDSSWCLRACGDLRRSLKGPDAVEAVARWKNVEELLGYPGMTKVSARLNSLLK